MMRQLNDTVFSEQLRQIVDRNIYINRNRCRTEMKDRQKERKRGESCVLKAVIVHYREKTGWQQIRRLLTNSKINL